MRSPPLDLADDRLLGTLDAGWGLRAGSLDYVPEGGGSHHWRLIDDDGRAHFVTIDDLDDKDWMADTRGAVLDGLGRALRTAAALRDRAGLDFVLAPVVARDGDVLARIDDRYAVSVFPYLTSCSYGFGPYPDAELRHRALDLVAALHRATPTVRDMAPAHVPRFGGEGDLEAFLADPTVPWDAGPFSEPARARFAERAGDLERLVAGFVALVDRTAPARSHPVITHGEPHPGNVLRTGPQRLLIDWDTAGLAWPERDLWSVTKAGTEDAARYEAATGHRPDPRAIEMYALLWALWDIGAFLRRFSGPHEESPDSVTAWEGLIESFGDLMR